MPARRSSPYHRRRLVSRSPERSDNRSRDPYLRGRRWEDRSPRQYERPRGERQYNPPAHKAASSSQRSDEVTPRNEKRKSEKSTIPAVPKKKSKPAPTVSSESDDSVELEIKPSKEKDEIN